MRAMNEKNRLETWSDWIWQAILSVEINFYLLCIVRAILENTSFDGNIPNKIFNKTFKDSILYLRAP